MREIKSKKIVAVSLNFDAAKEPTINVKEISKALSYVVDYLCWIEEPVR